MLWGSKNSGKKGQVIESLIGAGTAIDGNLVFKGGLRIDGAVRGSIFSAAGEPSMLVISEQARVEGEIRAAHIVINGAIVGPVHSTELIELQPNAKITGDVFYAALEMHQGAIVDGRLVHELNEKSPLKLASHPT
jgi:cytoskeletal protein CcmA (bactofilin family)